MLCSNMPESDLCEIPSLHGICTMKLITSWSYGHAKSSRRATQAAPNDMPCLAPFARSAHTVAVVACWTARPGHTTQPRLFRHQPHLFRHSWCHRGTLHRIALSSRNMSRRSCSSGTHSRSQGLVVVVVASLGTESVQNAAASKWAVRRLAGRLGCSTRHMVYTPALPKPTHATAMPALAMANSVHPSQSCGAVRVHPWRINLHPQNYCRPWGCRSR